MADGTVVLRNASRPYFDDFLPAAGSADATASAAVIRELRRHDTEVPAGELLLTLDRAVRSANERLRDLSKGDPALRGMGSSLTAMLWSGSQVGLVHIGDSRGYILRDGSLFQTTHDHTLVQSLVDEGRISPEEVAAHPQRSLLLRALDGRGTPTERARQPHTMAGPPQRARTPAQVGTPLSDDDPRQVAGYRILRRLVQGGMGRVYLAGSPGGRRVAVKVILPHFADAPGFRARFAREAEAARKVSGVFTAPVLDADPQADPPWLVTGYIPGPALRQAVEDHGPLPVRTLEILAAGLAEALLAVHRAGLVHRDLKPSNILLAADGPRVIDFGIVRAAVTEGGLTQTGAVIGTPEYMSPEQVRGERVGPAGDVFSLGAVLAFAATGVPPFGSGPAHTLGYRIVHTEPNLGRVPDGLRRLVAGCLRKSPSERPAPARVLELLESRVSEHSAPEEHWLPPRLRD